uniref:Uncharacterized protein n=1 Tax=Oryza barthii TaxID=65489 RepID=A0A0D3FHG0_9ORYZ
MGAVPLDPITPNLVNPNFFDLVMAKKMPLTVDHLMGMDRERHPDQLAKPRGDDGLLCAGQRKAPSIVSKSRKVAAGGAMEERMAAGEAKTVATDTERKPTRTAPTVRRTTSAEEKTPPSVYRSASSALFPRRPLLVLPPFQPPPHGSRRRRRWGGHRWVAALGRRQRDWGGELEETWVPP